jgi:hypothetical protein
VLVKIVDCKVRTRNEFNTGMMPLFIDKLESSKLPFVRYLPLGLFAVFDALTATVGSV